MADELLDVINKDNIVIGTKMKSAIHSDGNPHRVSAVLLKDKMGKYLIPTASEKKVESGGLFHSAAGHVNSGESYLEAARREVEEELGLKTKNTDFKMLGSFWLNKEYATRKEQERFEVYELIYTENMGKINMNDEQTNEQWISQEELKNIYLKNPDKLSTPLLLSCQNIFKF